MSNSPITHYINGVVLLVVSVLLFSFMSPHFCFVGKEVLLTAFIIVDTSRMLPLLFLLWSLYFPCFPYIKKNPRNKYQHFYSSSHFWHVFPQTHSTFASLFSSWVTRKKQRGHVIVLYNYIIFNIVFYPCHATFYQFANTFPAHRAYGLAKMSAVTLFFCMVVINLEPRNMSCWFFLPTCINLPLYSRNLIYDQVFSTPAEVPHRLVSLALSYVHVTSKSYLLTLLLVFLVRLFSVL